MTRRPRNDDLLLAAGFLRADAEAIGDGETKNQQTKRTLERVAAWLGSLTMGKKS